MKLKSFRSILVAFLAISASFANASIDLSLPGSRWRAVDRIIHRSVTAGVLSNVLFEVYDSQHHLVYQFSSGNFNRTSDTPILSASKWISTATIMSLVEKQVLDLDSPIRPLLRNSDGAEYTGAEGAISLRQLLSMTSGLDPNHACYTDPKLTLEECAYQILIGSADSPHAPPGTEFRYGDSHLSVAGFVATVATGKSWQMIFDELIARPLGFQSTSQYFSKPKSLKGAGNPRPAAGLRVSYDDYLKFLRMIFDRGVFQGRTILQPDSIAEMERDQFTPSVTIGFSDFQDLNFSAHYGLGQWLECNEPTCRGFVISSPGYYGFYPWIDRAHGYYAVLGAVEDAPVFIDVLKMVNELKPAIEAAL